MASIERVMRLRNELEARLLRISVAATLLIAGLGMLFGLLARSPAILFDGFFALIDVGVTWLTLRVARLVASQGDRRFQYGFWHLEPLVMALRASVLIVLVGYAFVSAVNSLLKGGYMPDFGIALAYAAVVAAICFGMWWWMRGHAERIDSGLVRLDVKAWLMSALITAALLVVFAAALALRGTHAEWLIPYMDPTVPELDARIRGVMEDFVARHGFNDFSSYVSRSGRALFVEIAVLVPPDLNIAVGELDDLRAEIGDEIGGAGPDRWLTIFFTADRAQL